jgi:hypothetical protein
MGERAERIARNEVLFREVNERMRELLDSMAPRQNGDMLEIFCECGLGDCMEKLLVSATDYEAARSRPERFLVAAGHEIPEVENVVASPDGHWVVEKHEEAAEIARATNPLS